MEEGEIIANSLNDQATMIFNTRENKEKEKNKKSKQNEMNNLANDDLKLNEDSNEQQKDNNNLNNEEKIHKKNVRY